MVGGLLADPELADSVIADGSADLVALGESLRAEPRWPHYAQSVLFDQENENEPQ
jgi:2,4-dienoyl-CoA reductase-like NADH-dependent reductase (Old Yellow Enzyme family)